MPTTTLPAEYVSQGIARLEAMANAGDAALASGAATVVEVEAAMPAGIIVAGLAVLVAFVTVQETPLGLYAARARDAWEQRYTTGVAFAIRAIRAAEQQARAYLATLPKTADADTSVDVSPARALRAELAELRIIVARIASWRRGHHGDVHLPEVRAWIDLEAGLDVVGQTVVELADADADAWHTLQSVVLPRLRERLQELVHNLREDFTQYRTHLNTEVLPRIDKRLDDDLERIHRLNTVTIPHLEHGLDVEAKTRARADTRLRRGLSEETDTRANTDSMLALELAPLVTWFRGFGGQTTTKVNKLEAPLDRFLGSDLSWLGALAFPPALLALVVRITSEVAPAIPAALGGIEEAATRALEAL